MRLVTGYAPGADPRPLLAAYRRHLGRTGRGNASYWWAAKDFFSRWPDPAMWAAEPLEVRLSASGAHRPVITFLMIHGHLRPGSASLLERTISSLWRELEATCAWTRTSPASWTPRPSSGSASGSRLRTRPR